MGGRTMARVWGFTCVVLATAVACFPYAVMTGVYLVSCLMFHLVWRENPKIQEGKEKYQLSQQRLTSITNSVVNTGLADVCLYRYARTGGYGVGGPLYAFRDEWPSVWDCAYVFTVPILILFLYDSWFYFTHRMFHEIKFLYTHVHSWHHKRSQPEAYDLFYMHPAEFIGAVLLPHLALPQIIPQHWMIFEALLVMTTLIDVYGHVGFDPSPFHPIQMTWYVHLPLPWRRIFLNVKHHDDHHRLQKGNYALFFWFWDTLLESGVRSR